MFFKRYRVLKLSGFDVSIDVSWILIVLLIIWSLAVSFFPTRYPNLSTSTYLWMAGLAAFGFFASVVAHEYCHSVVARYYGMSMKGITLWMLGGVAEMSDEPPSPKAEFLMAGAGPLASLGIAAICYVLAQIGERQNWQILATGVLGYLWRINFILAIFNLIPAFPLDGGRLLRAALWGWKGRMRWATKLAARIGGGFGAVLMVLGLFAFLTGNTIGGIWYFMIGLFIRLMAQSSYSLLIVKRSLSGISIRRLVRTPPVTVSANESIAGLVENYFYKYQRRLFPVVGNKGELVGSVRSEAIRDIPKTSWSERRVEDIMEPRTEKNTVEADADASSVVQRMNQREGDRLIVIDGDQIIGVISLNDILRFISMQLELNQEFEEADIPKKAERLKSDNAA